MEYSFSQTFGRHINFLAISPTPSFQGSNKKGSSEGRNSSPNDMSFEQSLNRSPVIQSYKISKSPLRNKKSTKSVFSDYINELARESKSKSELKRYEQTIRRKKQADLMAQIENVEGLNQRMVKLIQDLKSDCYEKKSTKRQIGKENEDTKRKESSSKKKQKIEKCRSYTGFENNNKFVNNNTQSKDFRSKYLIRQGKDYHMKQGFEEKANELKVRIEERLNTRKKTQSIFVEDPQNELSLPLSIKNANLITSPHINSNFLTDKISQNRSQLKIGKKTSIGSVNSKQMTRESYIKSKVKTIESQLQTNFNQLQEDTVIETINEISLIENGSKIQNDSLKKDESSITQDLNETQNSEKQKVCKQCGYQKKAVKKKLNANQSYASSQRNWSKNFGKYESIGFQDKIKKINEKIQNYQKKLNMHTQIKKAPIPISGKTGVISIKKRDNGNIEAYEGQENFEEGNKVTRPDPLRLDRKQKQMMVRETKNEAKHDRNPNIHQPQQGFEIYETKKKTEIVDIPFNNKQNFSFTKNKQILNNTLNLQKVSAIKEKIGFKLGLSTSASAILKQIQLDQEFRRIKKQFSKLPSVIPECQKTKWDYLAVCLQKSDLQKNSLTKQFCRQNFELTDEEADPFYSVSVQDMRNYKDIIKELIALYISSQDHFKNNLEGKFTGPQISAIFKFSQLRSSGIRLDQFTVWINNSTKINHKCRDVYLLFKRIWLRRGKKGDAKKDDQYFTIQDLQAVLEISTRGLKFTQDMGKQKKCIQKVDRRMGLRMGS